MKKKKRVSSKDVAQEAGVSQATVSYVLNDVKNVKIRPETRKAVLDAAKKLNYHPSNIARGMKLSKSMSVGVITDRSVTNYNFMKTLQGIKDGLKEDNYTITFIFNRDEKDNNEILEYYSTSRIDGFIFCFSSVSDEIKDELSQKDIPFVIIDSHAFGKKAPQICTDHLERLPDLCSLFKSKGAKKLAYFGPRWRFKCDARIEAFNNAIAMYGLENGGIYLCSFHDDDDLKSVAREIIFQGKNPDGIIAGNPWFGFHVLKSAAELEIKIPKDLVVASLGTSNYYELCYPSMTAVELPLYDMGFSGAKMLINIINDKDTEEKIVLPSEIVIRDSL